MCVKSHSESGQSCGFEPCEQCKQLEAENAAMRQERDRLAGIMEKADALYQASKFHSFRKEFEKAQDDYQEARHARVS